MCKCVLLTNWRSLAYIEKILKWKKHSSFENTPSHQFVKNVSQHDKLLILELDNVNLPTMSGGFKTELQENQNKLFFFWCIWSFQEECLFIHNKVMSSHRLSQFREKTSHNSNKRKLKSDPESKETLNLLMCGENNKLQNEKSSF